MKYRFVPSVVLALTINTATAEIDLPEEFDYMGPSVQTYAMPDGRNVAFVDTGPENGMPVLFLGGTGTSAAVVQLTDFLRTMREALNLRLISVGRAGFGQSDPASDWTFEDYAADATAVLDSLGIDEVTIIAISGGGPYSAAFAAKNPDRVRSIHLAAATSLATKSSLCEDSEKMTEVMNDYAAHPLKWWAFPEESPTHKIPGFSTAAANDGARTFSIAGQKGSGTAEVEEYTRYCTLPLPDVSAVEAPVFIYQGLKDTLVTPVHAQRWSEVYPNIAKLREYPDGGHDVQYRHWDQILIDMAGMENKLVICQDGESRLVPEDQSADLLNSGATLGICAWQTD